MEIISLENLSKKFEVAGQSVTITKEEENFFIIDETISLYYDEYEYEYKRKNLTRFGWIVGYDKHIPGSYWQPDDVDFIEDSHYTSLNPAIARVCALLIEWKLNQYDESQLSIEDFV